MESDRSNGGAHVNFPVRRLVKHSQKQPLSLVQFRPLPLYKFEFALDFQGRSGLGWSATAGKSFRKDSRALTKNGRNDTDPGPFAVSLFADTITVVPDVDMARSAAPALYEIFSSSRNSREHPLHKGRIPDYLQEATHTRFL